MDVNTANILPLIWASKFNLALPNLADPVPSMANSMPVTNTSANACSNLTRSNVVTNSPNGPSMWPAAAAAAALSNDLTTSFKQLLANAAAAAVNGNGIGSTFPQEASEAQFNGLNLPTPVTNGFTGNGSSNGSSNGPLSPSSCSINGMNLQQALIARLGQAAAAASFLGDKQSQQQQSVGCNYPMQSPLQLSNSKLMHLMPNYCTASSPGKQPFFTFLKSTVKLVELSITSLEIDWNRIQLTSLQSLAYWPLILVTM